MEIYKKDEDDIFYKISNLSRFTKSWICSEGKDLVLDLIFWFMKKDNLGKKGAKYLVFALNEGTQEKILHVQRNIEQITNMGKEPIIAVIERRGEVIYYKISKIDFLKNEKSREVTDFNF